MQKYLLRSTNAFNQSTSPNNLNFLNENLVESTCLESQGRVVRLDMVDTVIEN